jgi:hypothetical protein
MVQPKYSPEEALEKMKLMMKYDSSKTLNENRQIVSEQSATQVVGGVGGGLLATGAGAATAATLATTLGAVGSAVPIVGTAAGIIIGYGLGTLIDWAANHDYGEEGFRQVMTACSAKGVDKLVPKLSKADVRQIAYSIEDAKGQWNDDEDAIASALAKIPTIADLCAVDKKIAGGLAEFLDNLTDSPDEWKMFTRPLAGMIEDTEIVLTPEEQKKTGGGNSGGGGGSKTGGYKPCTGTYKKGCKSDVIAKVQGCLSLVTDGKFGPKTQAALSAKGFETFTDADVTKICQSKPTEVEPEISGETQTINGNSDF